jgi:histidyl-tRNA synthetase
VLSAGVEAEAELLSAVTTFFSRVGLTSADVGLKVSSRKVLAAVLERFEVPPENFAQVRHVTGLELLYIFAMYSLYNSIYFIYNKT